MNTRIHKYKVYDTELKKFVSGFEAFDKVCGWENDETGSHIILRQERYIVLQWTGLYDSKKVEAYEGDIVREPDGRIYVVEWETSEACFVLAINDPIYGRHTRHFKDIKIMEIIGSIHTTPELL